MYRVFGQDRDLAVDKALLAPAVPGSALRNTPLPALRADLLLKGGGVSDCDESIIPSSLEGEG